MNYEEKLAKLACDYSINVKKGDVVYIESPIEALELVKELYKYILLKGALPVTRFRFDDEQYYFYKHSDDMWLEKNIPWQKSIYENVSARIYISCSYNSQELANVDFSRVSKHRGSLKGLREILNEREEKGEYEWIIIPYPTQAMAQNANMSYHEYREFVFNACKLNEPDFIQAWKDYSLKQQKIVDRLQGSSKLHILGHKTDLTLDVKDRSWINCDGHRNMPDGEVFTSPVENSANGYIYFDVPTTYSGNEASGVYLEFENGICTKAEAERGADFLKNMIGMDEGSNKLGEVAIATNDNIQVPTKDILFDEKIGGTMHLALGSSYPEAGGKNKSGLHWDLVKSMKENSSIAFDGEILYKNGKFLIDE